MTSQINIKFCDMCDNMLYIKVNEQKHPHFYCKCCNYVRNIDEENEIITILDKDENIDALEYSAYLNPNLQYDPTLPHINIPCPNSDCNKPKDKDNDVIFIRYNHNNMKHIYICTYCKNNWLIN